MMDNENLESLRDQILNLTKQYFEEKTQQQPAFVPYISDIPVTGKVLNGDDIMNLVDSSLDAWLTAGRFSDMFEEKIRKYLGVRHCLFVNSGSSANLLAISALKIHYDIKDGGVVITSAVNFPTTMNPIIQNNLKPILVDVESQNYNVNPKLIEDQINDQTVGIVLAHALGNPFQVNEIVNIAKKYNLFLMEDSCDAFGSTFDQNFVGTFGDVATLSFYPAHHITTGEGGAVLTNNTKLKKILESLRDWGRDCYCKPGEDNTCKKRFDWQLGGLPHGYDHKYIYSHIGYNLKATDMQAAIGLSQIEKLDDFILKEKENFKYLYEKFSEIDEFELPNWYDLSDPSWFGFPLTIKNNSKINRLELLKHYQNHKIGTRLLFGGNVTLQPAYEKLNLGNPSDYPEANRVANNSFWLGVYPGLTQEMLDFMIDSTKEFIISK